MVRYRHVRGDVALAPGFVPKALRFHTNVRGDMMRVALDLYVVFTERSGKIPARAIRRISSQF